MSPRTVQVSLPDHLAAEVASAVARGEYESECDAILVAVAEWRVQRLAETIGVEDLRRLWKEGADSGPGRSMSIEEIKAETRRRFRDRDTVRIARTARAEEELIDIWTYIALDNEQAADRVLDAPERTTRLLASNPNIWRDRFDIAAGARSVVSGTYLILYRILADEVEVVRYVHVRRQSNGLL